MSLIYSQTVTRLRATQLRGTNGAKVPQRDWANANSLSMAGVSIQPVQTTDAKDAGGVHPTDEWVMFSQRGVRLDVVVGDRILWDGRLMDVTGTPQVWAGIGQSTWHHSEIHMKQSPRTTLGATGADGTLRDRELGPANTSVTYSP